MSHTERQTPLERLVRELQVDLERKIGGRYKHAITLLQRDDIPYVHAISDDSMYRHEAIALFMHCMLQWLRDDAYCRQLVLGRLLEFMDQLEDIYDQHN